MEFSTWQIYKETVRQPIGPKAYQEFGKVPRDLLRHLAYQINPNSKTYRNPHHNIHEAAPSNAVFYIS